MNERMKTLFLADSHLCGSRDPNQRAMVEFLVRRGKQCRLVLLGDIFEFLAGRNRAAESAYAPVLEALAGFAEIDLLEGNHDFDLSPEITGLGRARIHPGPALLEIDGRRVLAVHGDRSSPFDLGTRLLRRFLQSAPTRYLRDRVLPQEWLFRFALRFARVSRWKSWPGRSQEAAHSLRQALSLARRHRARLAVFAHTHHPLLRREGRLVIANPGMAVEGGSYLELGGGRISLRAFPGGEILSPGPLAVEDASRTP